MNQLKTYTIRHKKAHDVWLFKYHVDGTFESFTVLGGVFNKNKYEWLQGVFPYNEEIIKTWIVDLKRYFDIEIDTPEITFAFFYKTYGKSVTKKQAKDFWDKKMKPADRINAVIGSKRYDNWLKLYPYREKVDPIRFLRNRRYEDEF